MNQILDKWLRAQGTGRREKWYEVWGMGYEVSGKWAFGPRRAQGAGRREKWYEV